jgi:hypothetical protein
MSCGDVECSIVVGAGKMTRQITECFEVTTLLMSKKSVKSGNDYDILSSPKPFVSRLAWSIPGRVL